MYNQPQQNIPIDQRKRGSMPNIDYNRNTPHNLPYEQNYQSSYMPGNVMNQKNRLPNVNKSRANEDFSKADRPTTDNPFHNMGSKDQIRGNPTSRYPNSYFTKDPDSANKPKLKKGIISFYNCQ